MFAVDIIKAFQFYLLLIAANSSLDNSLIKQHSPFAGKPVCRLGVYIKISACWFVLMETKFVNQVDGHTISIDSWFSKERNPFPLGGLGMVTFRFSLSINVSFKIECEIRKNINNSSIISLLTNHFRVDFVPFTTSLKRNIVVS